MDNLVDWKSETIQPGQKYGRLTIISTHKIAGTYRYVAKCQCQCNVIKYIRMDALRKGMTLSCGCLQKERSTKHGAWDHPLYTVWKSMMRRCYNQKDDRYNRYGGRGITVCKKWHDINIFINDMTQGYQKGLQIDRIDNDKGYSKNNCQWANRFTQAQNKSSNIKLTHDNKNLCLSEWSRITKIPYGTLWERIKVLKWSTERTLTTPSLSASERLSIARGARAKKGS